MTLNVLKLNGLSVHFSGWMDGWIPLFGWMGGWMEHGCRMVNSTSMDGVSDALFNDPATLGLSRSTTKYVN